MRHDLTRADLLAHAVEIAREFHDDKLPLTLRGLYYQLVSRGFMPSGGEHYKRTGEVVTAARYAGTFPIEFIEDRGRDVVAGSATRADHEGLEPDDVAQDARTIMRRIPDALVQAGRWRGQPNFVSVWLEKEALAGIFEKPCNELGVSWFPVRGYPSLTGLFEWLKYADQACHRDQYENWYFFASDLVRTGFKETYRQYHRGRAKRCIILYYGDHDPDGWEIPRSAERNLAKIQEMLLRRKRDGTLPEGMIRPWDVKIEFRRVALNMDQIQQYNPPPFWAKESSSRYDKYVAEHDTTDAWELDALDPHVTRDSVTHEVSALFDEAIHAEQQTAVEDMRAQVRTLAGLRFDDDDDPADDDPADDVDPVDDDPMDEDAEDRFEDEE
jgi:hypothetical protein